MATKRKARRYDDGGLADDATGVDEAIARNADSGEWARGENYGDNTTGNERVAMARAPAREASAEEVMAANKFAPSARPRPRPAAPAPQQAARVATAAKEVASDLKKAESKAEAPSGPRVGRASQASGPTVRRAEPTAEGRAAANEKRAQQQADASERLGRVGSAIGNYLRRTFTPSGRMEVEDERRAAARSGMKRGGSVKQTASSRGDGIAKRGKTRGKLR